MTCIIKSHCQKLFCFSQVTSEWFCFSAVIPSSDHLWVECFVSAMAGRPPKRRAEDQHSIPSFFRTKRPDKDMEAATSVSSEEERIDDEPCFDVNVVEEQSPSGVASGGEITAAAGDMVQCQPRSETSSSCQTQHNKLVFKALSGESCTEEEKRSIIAGRTNCDLPYTLVRDQRKQSGYSKRFLRRQSFANFDWLAYYDGDGDTDKAGVFCLACSLFPAVHREGSRRADYLVTKIQTNFKKLREDALRHDGLEYHRDSGIRLKTFLTTSQQHSLRLDARITKESKKRVDANRAILLSIIRCLELARRQGISLRGHRDNLTEDSPQDNFHALITFAIAAGDTALKVNPEAVLCRGIFLIRVPFEICRNPPPPQPIPAHAPDLFWQQGPPWTTSSFFVASDKNISLRNQQSTERTRNCTSTSLFRWSFSWATTHTKGHAHLYSTLAWSCKHFTTQWSTRQINDSWIYDQE